MKYRKIIEIEARQITDFNMDQIAKWCHGKVLTLRDGLHYYGIVIASQEGDMLARRGDWVIKGKDGEFYPCKSDIFAATYEEVKP